MATPEREHWREIVPHRDDVMIEALDLFANHYVLSELEAGLPQFRITNIVGGESHRVTFPEPTYAAFGAMNRTWDTTTFRYEYESLVTPESPGKRHRCAGPAIAITASLRRSRMDCGSGS